MRVIAGAKPCGCVTDRPCVKGGRASDKVAEGQQSGEKSLGVILVE